VRNRRQLEPGLERMKATGVERIHGMRDEMRADKAFERGVRGSQKAAQVQPAWLLVRELMRPLLLDPNKTVKPNDVMDLFHAAVPVAYCDFVLLDAQWEDCIRQIRQRFIDHRIGRAPAEVFSKKRDGLERFFQALESSPKVIALRCVRRAHSGSNRSGVSSMVMRQILSPSYQHNKLENPSLSDLIDVFEDTWRGYVLTPYEALLKMPCGEVAAMTVISS